MKNLNSKQMNEEAKGELIKYAIESLNDWDYVAPLLIYVAEKDDNQAHLSSIIGKIKEEGDKIAKELFNASNLLIVFGCAIDSKAVETAAVNLNDIIDLAALFTLDQDYCREEGYKSPYSFERNEYGHIIMLGNFEN